MLNIFDIFSSNIHKDPVLNLANSVKR